MAAALLGGCGGGGPSFSITKMGLVGEETGPTGAAHMDGGDTVRILGVGFEEGAEIFFGTQASPSVTHVSGSELLAMSPAMPEGYVDLTVRNPDGAETTRSGAFYFGVPPQAVSIEAISGPTLGRPSVRADTTALVELKGGLIKDGAEVLVDGEPMETTFVDAVTLHFTVSSHPVDADLDVTVRNPGGLKATLTAALFIDQSASTRTQPGGLSDAQLRHLLRRAAFAVSPARFDRDRSISFSQVVDSLLRITQDASLTEAERFALDIYGDNRPPSTAISTRTNEEWWIHLIRNNPHPLQEKLAFFLHDHFATSQSSFSSDERWWIHEQINLFRRFPMPRNQGGMDYDWEELCVQICKDRAMLDWLDGENSRKGRPNENFARELWELFMLGEGRGYTQEDIVEASRAFTGFDDFDVEVGDEVIYETHVYHLDRHDETEKNIFGVTGYFGYDSVSPYHEGGTHVRTDARDLDGGVVALTLRERPYEASTFICGKLAAYFLYEDPPIELVEDLADTLRNNDWNMRPVLQKILRSKAMFSRRARKDKIKAPVEFVFEFLRSADVDYPVNRIRGALGDLNQSVMNPPDVNGWPTGNAWMGGQAMLERINFLKDVVETLDDVPTQIHPLIPPAGRRSPGELLDHLQAVLDVEISDVARAKLTEYVTTTVENDQVVPFAYDPTNDQHLRMKTRGLLYLLAQYHNGHRH